MTLARGIDISAYQIVNYRLAARAVQFVIVMATEGAHTTSDAWARHWKGVRDAGLLAGSYHICHPEQGHSPAIEAHHYTSALRAAGWRTRRDLPPCLDIEPKAASIGRQALTTWAEAFMSYVDRELGLTEPWLRCGFYVGDSIARKVDIARLNRGRWFWRGGFGSTWPHTIPDGCCIYQQSGRVSLVEGVVGQNLDVDVARLDDLRSLAPHHFAKPIARRTRKSPEDPDMAFQTYQVKRPDGTLDPAIYAQTADGAAHVKNPTCLRLGQESGLYKPGKPIPITQAELDDLLEVEK